MNALNYRKVLISGRQCLIGSVPFEKIPFLSLQVGDKISKIGKGNTRGRETSSNRFDSFTDPVIYQGVFRCRGVRFIAFQLSNKNVTGWGLHNTQGDVFILYSFYENNKQEIYQSVPTEIRIYQSHFNKVKS